MPALWTKAWSVNVSEPAHERQRRAGGDGERARIGAIAQDGQPAALHTDRAAVIERDCDGVGSRAGHVKRAGVVERPGPAEHSGIGGHEGPIGAALIVDDGAIAQDNGTVIRDRPHIVQRAACSRAPPELEIAVLPRRFVTPVPLMVPPVQKNWWTREGDRAGTVKRGVGRQH